MSKYKFLKTASHTNGKVSTAEFLGPQSTFQPVLDLSGMLSVSAVAEDTYNARCKGEFVPAGGSNPAEEGDLWPALPSFLPGVVKLQLSFKNTFLPYPEKPQAVLHECPFLFVGLSLHGHLL